MASHDGSLAAGGGGQRSSTKRARLIPLAVEESDNGDVGAAARPVSQPQQQLQQVLENAQLVLAGDEQDQDFLVEADSNAAIVFKILASSGRVLHQFSPQFSHQLFPDEVIYGYHDLHIDVFMSLNLDTHVSISFSGSF